MVIELKNSRTVAGGGRPAVFLLDNDEYITEVYGRAGFYVDQLQFKTSKGRVSPVYGGGGGAPFKVAPKDAMGRPMVLKAIYGSCGLFVDKIGFYFAETVPIKYEMKTLTYDVQHTIYNESEPIAIKTAYLQNKTAVSQYVSNTFSMTTTNAEWVEMDHAVGVSATFGFSASGGFQGNFTVGGSVTVGFNYTFTYKTQHSYTTSTTESFEFHANVGPYSTVKATAVMKVGTYNVPWEGTALVTYSNSSTPVLEHVSGVLKGVKTASVVAEYETVN